MHKLFVIGGARSGKSRYAQVRAEETGLSPIFIATAQACDDEMGERIARHQADRGSDWRTVEAPLDLPQAIAAHSLPDTVVLIDCITLWITNLLMANRDITVAARALARSISLAQGPIILVSNEVGWGIVPDNALARRFRDEAGSTHQLIAAAADEVQLLVAGLAMRLK